MAVEDKVKEIIVEQLGVDPSEVTLEASFINDLGADSLDTVELIMEFEDEFGLEISDEEAEKVSTVGEAMRFVSHLIREEIPDSVVGGVFAVRLRSDGSFEVRLRCEDGSWCYADGARELESGLCYYTLSSMSVALRELEELVNDPQTKESDLQDFFTRHPEILAGDDYDRVIPQATIVPLEEGRPWRADFVLAPIDQQQFAKVIELKSPKLPLTGSRVHGHARFTRRLLDALQQLRDYGEALSRPATRDRFNERYRTDILLPELQLIIGREWDVAYRESLFRLQSEQRVDISDWVSFVKKLKRRYG